MFSAASNYFMAFTLNGISNSVFSQDINIAATWTTMDGTVVTAAEEDERDVVIGDVLPDLFAGVGFEDPMDSGVVTQRTGITSTDKIEIVTYESESVTPAPNGGANVLWIENSDLSKDNYWTHFRINFGAAVPEGTKVSFYVYGYDSSGEGTNPAQLFFAAPGQGGGDRNQVGIVSNGEWKEISFTLSNQKAVDGEDRYADLGYVDLFYWNGYDSEYMAGLSEDEANWSGFLIDNITLTAPFDYDLTSAALDFETAGMEAAIEKIDSTVGEVKRVAYADESMSYADGGSYGVKLENCTSYPHLRMNFGSALPVGTEITFDVYTTGFGGGHNFEYVSGGNATLWFEDGAWTTLTLKVGYKINKNWETGEETLEQIATDPVSSIEMFTGNENGSKIVYIDNIKIKEAEYVLDITQGVDFETAGMEAAIEKIDSTVGAVKRVAYADESMSYADGGSYGVKLENCTSYPHLRMNFGSALPVGTEITFDVYTTGFGGGHNFEYVSGGNATLWFEDGAWTTLTLKVGYKINKNWETGEETLEQIATDPVSSIEMFTGNENGSKIVYIDNIKIKEAEYVLDITQGVDFETSGMEAAITRSGSNFASAERVTYTDAGISAPANGGTYAMKLSGNTNRWPHFQIHFGTTLTEGSVITFDGYVDPTNVTSDNTNIAYDGGGFPEKHDADHPNGDWTAHAKGTWTSYEVYVRSTDVANGYVDLYFDIETAAGNDSTDPQVIYIDNLAYTPAS